MPTATAHVSPAAVVREHPGLVKVARAGWFAKGVVYVLAGVIAFLVFAHSFGWSGQPAPGKDEASPTGAVKTVADAPGGTALLVVLAIGMFLYALWRLLTAVLPGGKDAEGWAKRAGYLASAGMYIALGATALSLMHKPATSKNGNAQVTDLASKAFRHAAGRWAFGLVGLILIGAGIYRLVSVAKAKRDEEVDLSGMSEERRTATCTLQRIGDGGRGIALVLVGFFLARAAVTYDPQEATGLDGALRRLASHTWGAMIVGVTAAGLVAYGVYCLATFHRRVLRAP